MAKNNPYIGKIGNAGTQEIKVATKKSGGKAKVKTGKDLRVGK